VPSHPYGSGGDPRAQGIGQQRLKLGAIGYSEARHGVDATLERAQAARMVLRRLAVEYAEAVTGTSMKNRRIDKGDDELLCFAAIAYTGSRHGIDADVGMAREGMGMLCQEAINFAESLPREESSKRPGPRLHLGEGAR
jgi:hypothetical protein